MEIAHIYIIGMIQVHVHIQILHNYENEVTYVYCMIWFHAINNNNAYIHSVYNK